MAKRPMPAPVNNAVLLQIAVKLCGIGILHPMGRPLYKPYGKIDQVAAL